MLSIFLRTLLIYVLLIATVRLMGKRQIGELEVTDLVTTLLLSELAALPITDLNIPVSHAVIPMVTLLFLEVLSAVVLICFPRLKGLVSARPTVIMQEGRLNQAALRSSRISVEELMGEARQQGYTDLEQLSDAILEKNGKLTLLPKPQYAQPTVQQLSLPTKNDQLMHVVLYNGVSSRRGLALIEKDEQWLLAALQKQALSPQTLFCVTANRAGDLRTIPMDPPKKKEKKT